MLTIDIPEEKSEDEVHLQPQFLSNSTQHQLEREQIAELTKEYIKQHGPIKTSPIVQRSLKASFNGLIYDEKPFTGKYDQLIAKEYPHGNLNQLAGKLGIAITYVHKRAHKMGLKRIVRSEKQKLADKRKQVVKAKLGKESPEAIARELGIKDVRYVKQIAKRMMFIPEAA